jgi:hypothetical protein
MSYFLYAWFLPYVSGKSGKRHHNHGYRRGPSTLTTVRVIYLGCLVFIKNGWGAAFVEDFY